MTKYLPQLPLRGMLYKLLLLFFLLFGGLGSLSAQFYPVHGVVQWPAPQSPHLVDYYSGSRDRLIITLHNRDLQQPLLLARLRIQIKSNGFLAQTREEMPYPMLELSAGTPTRLTATDLMPYLRPESLLFNGRLREGKLPTGFTEISVQVLDYYSRKELSAWHTARAYLDSKHPPILNLPQRDEQVAFREPLFLRFQWYPRHQGLAGTEYEFVLKELPDNGAAPQSAFAYGNEIYRVRTRNTFLNYTHLEPILLPNRRYAWQVQAIARDGIDEIGMFENRGFSEIYWFTLNENCPVPTGLKAQARYAKADFSWDRVVGATGYMLACRPKTSKNIYEWSEVLSYGERITLAQLKPGWTYEWRVGTLCTGDRPIYSPIQEVTLPKNNEELLASCGKEPPRRDLRQEPRLDVAPGDTITIGGDYPMLITEIKSLGDGWYSGRGKTSLRSIIEVPHVALRFDRLRINVDNFQIDGLVDAVYDDKKALANLDQLDDGGKPIKPSQLGIRTQAIAFALPPKPTMSFNAETGEIEVSDASGKPQRIKLELPEGAKPESVFPMVITDSEGKSYQVTEPQSEYKDDARRSIGATKDDLIPQRKALQVEPVERVSGFSRDKLETKARIGFAKGLGRYAFDPASEDWYRKAVKLDLYYKPFDKGYIAPWKLVPVGERDVVEAYIDNGEALPSEVKFVLESGQSLPAKFDEATQRWRLELPSLGANESYDVFALVAGKTAGKLRVVSYPKHHYKLRLVPVNGQSVSELTALAWELNAIYNPLGISFALTESEGMQTAIDKSQLKRELRRLIRDYQEEHSLEADEVCVFVLSPTLSKGTKFEDLEGLMPRNSRFGYIFAGNSPNEAGSTDVASLARTLAHELGHGLFTLRHTFDSEYGGKKSRGKTQNLMDYSEGAKSLAAFQWNIIANPAPLTALDKTKDAEIRNSEGDLIALQKLEEELRQRGDGYIGIRLRCEQYRSQKQDVAYFTDSPRSFLQPYIVSRSRTYVYGILSFEGEKPMVQTHIKKESRVLYERISKTDADLLLLHLDEEGELRYCDANTGQYPDICKQKDFRGLEKYLEQFKRDISACRKAGSSVVGVGEVQRLLLEAKGLFAGELELAVGDKVYRLNASNLLEELDKPLSDDAINRGLWQSKAEEYTRFTLNGRGILQVRAFGINPKLKLAKGKQANLVEVARNFRDKTNTFLSRYEVRDFRETASSKGIDFNTKSETYADGDAVRVDKEAPLMRLVVEGYSASKSLLKTSELPPSLYRSSEKDKVALHAPGLVTGATEVLSQKLTDLTSLAVLVYDVVTDEATRKGLVEQFRNIKTQIGEDPKAFFPILGDVILAVATGNTTEEWQKTQQTSDAGERSHLLTRGTGNAVLTAMAGGAIIKDLPEVADKLSDAIKKAKKVARHFTEQPFDELGKLRPNIRFKTGEFGYWGETDELGRLESMSTDNLRLTEREQRLRHNPQTEGKQVGDHAGHLIADRFGGSPELDNLVSQLKDVNLRTYKYHENLWAEALRKGQRVELKIKVLYNGDELRPSGFKLDYKIGQDEFNIPIIKN